jgi:glutamate/tyrosine decarboxylase-like PLP-dependent enzyme
MHGYSASVERLAQRMLHATLDRLRDDPALGSARTPQELDARVGHSIGAEGIGGKAALQIWTDHLAPANVAVDHPRYLAFIPGAPTPESVLFDMLVSAESIYGGSWLEAAGATHAENEALAWLAGLAGFPATAGGCFVPGGTTGNLSALVAARHTALERRGGTAPPRWQAAISAETHSSVVYALERVMDVDTIRVPVDDRGRLTGAALAEALEGADPDALMAVIATAGNTNLGTVDDLAGIARVCADRGVWMHVDGAYGAAALAASSARHLLAGIEQADSFIVDPHKWLFAPYDCCALVYRDPEAARRTHTQHADYLDAVTSRGEWNPSDYAVHLSRRARGLPFWFSLVAHGTSAYTEAVETTLAVTRSTAEQIRRRPDLELLLEPELSVVVFARARWTAADYAAWSADLAHRGVAFVTPTTHGGQPCIRLAIVNPRTTIEDIEMVLDTLA